MRRLTTKILLLCLVLTAGTVDVSAKRWRNLTPAHSTKFDAAALVKECDTPKMGCHFEDDNSEVQIIFSGGDLVDGKCPNMPAGTLLAVVVKFKRPQPLKNFRLKNQKEIFFDPSSPPNHGYKGYYYPAEGFIISSFEGRVVTVVYVAQQKDLHLCPEYYEDPKGFVEVGIYR
jgi:hypothetical protein